MLLIVKFQFIIKYVITNLFKRKSKCADDQDKRGEIENMSLTRKSLVAMGIEDAKIEQIIEMHTETVNALKNERDEAKEKAEQYKSDSEKLSKLQKEYDSLSEQASKPNPYKEKFEELKKEYDNFKSEQETKAVESKKKELYKALLKEMKVSDKRINAVVRLTDMSKIELNEDGSAIKDIEEQKKNIENEWSDYIVTEDEHGQDTPKPPANGGSGVQTPSFATQRALAYRGNLYGEIKKEV